MLNINAQLLTTKHRTNNQIKAAEVRLIGPEGENLGIISTTEAISKAQGLSLDLVEISSNTNPPIAKIVDYGKFLYSENKKQRTIKSKIHTTEIKNIQIKLGTGEHDLSLKAKKISAWLNEGDRVKVDLFLPGRTKYMDQNFLRERMDRVLKLISTEFKIASEPQKSPKGLTTILERAK